MVVVGATFAREEIRVKTRRTMQREDDQLVGCIGALALVLVLVFGVATCAEHWDDWPQNASAQDRPVPAALAAGGFDFTGQDMAPAVVLARVTWKEAGDDGFADLPAIAAVLLAIGHGDVVRGARLHSRRVFQPAQLGRRPWIAFLRGDLSEPRCWPHNLSWRSHRSNWQAMIGLARAVLSDGEERPELPCAPQTWGGECDRERARRLGLIRVDCGNTRNDFYVYPRRR